MLVVSEGNFYSDCTRIEGINFSISGNQYAKNLNRVIMEAKHRDLMNHTKWRERERGNQNSNEDKNNGTRGESREKGLVVEERRRKRNNKRGDKRSKDLKRHIMRPK